MPASRPLALFATAAALVAMNTPASATESVEALIKRQSQEFSDASASGDAAVFARLLDDRVVFLNETGEQPTKKDLVEGAAPPPKGQSNSLKQTDFQVEVHGPVAVTKFVDVLTQQFHGQTLHARFLSTEVWLKEGASWRMISSQTMTLAQDPPAVALPQAVLDEYVGTYRADADYSYRIARAGDGLVATIGDGQPVALEAEVKDVLFTPGQPTRRKIVQRDANGKVTGLIARNAGRDVVLRRVD